MPDADDFDVESLRALLRGESPAPAKDAKPKAKPAPKPARAATRGAKGPKSAAPGKKPRKP